MAVRADTRIAFVVDERDDERATTATAWINWFARAGYDVGVIALAPDSVSARLDPRVRMHDTAPPGGYPATVSHVRRALTSGAYGGVIAVGTYPNLVTIAAARRVSAPGRPIVIATEHDLLSLSAPGSSAAHRLRLWLAKRSYRHADVVTSASHPGGAEMAAAFGVPASRSLVVPDPVMAAVHDRRRVRAAPSATQGVRLVIAGTLATADRPQLAIRAARALEDRGIPTEVLSFGGGGIQGTLSALADQLGVRYSARREVRDTFAQLDETAVVISTARGEGLGGALIEAAAHGVPSVAISTALGVADAIIPGITGELSLDDDPDSIADAVERAAGLRVTGVDEWLDRFTAESTGHLLESAIAYARERKAA